jgi:hypothetical protein
MEIKFDQPKVWAGNPLEMRNFPEKASFIGRSDGKEG